MHPPVPQPQTPPIARDHGTAGAAGVLADGAYALLLIVFGVFMGDGSFHEAWGCCSARGDTRLRHPPPLRVPERACRRGSAGGGEAFLALVGLRRIVGRRDVADDVDRGVTGGADLDLVAAAN